jgi:hypothetical protein
MAGNWNLMVNSPMGLQHMRLALRHERDQLVGTVTNNAAGVTSEIFDARLDGDQLSWKFKTQFKLTLSFTTTVQGETMTGRVKAGMFGSFDVTGEAESDQPLRTPGDW